MKRQQRQWPGLQIAMRRIPMMRKPGYDRGCGAWQSRFEWKGTPGSARDQRIRFVHRTKKHRTARMRLLGSGVGSVTGQSAGHDCAGYAMTTA